MREDTKVRQIVALLLLIGVLAIFVSPAADLPVTVLRGKQTAVKIAMALIAAATIVSAALNQPICTGRLPVARSAIVLPAWAFDSPLPLLC